MEIVKEGSVPPPELWTTTLTCSKDDEHDKKQGCGTQLKAGPPDLVLMYFRGTHFHHYYTAVQCPRCMKYNRVCPPEVVWRPVHTPENKANAIFDGFQD
ncbi:MAG TPA: hypothetical protein VG984_03380 [Candidatus Paceibacterota bacterium]|nr:hypothetical protein [Candidatus Paceibacterota bacterium]